MKFKRLALDAPSYRRNMNQNKPKSLICHENLQLRLLEAKALPDENWRGGIAEEVQGMEGVEDSWGVEGV